MTGQKVLVATPCFGNVVSANYVMSFLETSAQAAQAGVQMGLLLLGNYSIVTDARNFCASIALQDEWDKLFFIDADQSWYWHQAEAILKSERFLVGGSYPLKKRPLELNFLPLKKDEHYFLEKEQLVRSPLNFANWKKEEADESGEAPVRALPGGFMCVSRLVLEKLAQGARRYQDKTSEKTQECYEIFRSSISEEGGRLTEDYTFCVDAKAAGFDSWLQTKAIVRHEGNHVFEWGKP